MNRLDRAIAVHPDGLDAITFAPHIQQFAAVPPLQGWQLHHPLLQQLFGLFRSEPEATHPVVIQSLAGFEGEGSNELSPKTGLPTADFMAVRSTHSSGTEHSSQPWARRQQQCLGPTAGCLNCCGCTTGPSPPDHNVPAHRSVLMSRTLIMGVDGDCR